MCTSLFLISWKKLTRRKKIPGIETLLGSTVSINTLLCVLAELNPKVTSRNHVLCLLEIPIGLAIVFHQLRFVPAEVKGACQLSCMCLRFNLYGLHTHTHTHIHTQELHEYQASYLLHSYALQTKMTSKRTQITGSKKMGWAGMGDC